MAQTKQQNNPGLGIEYEVHIPAYFALLLNNNPEIEDFQLRSNVPGFGNLDDLLIDIKTKSDENLYFAFQLKHKEDSKKNLLPTNFEARGDFNLEKYCEAFKKLNEENRKRYRFILYTNKNFDSSLTNKVKNFCMKATHDVCCFGKNFFDTSSSSNSLYKFEVKEETEEEKNVNKEDYEDFFSKFSLYTRQASIRDLAKSILDILKYKECYATYIDFFRSWHRGDFTDFNNKILDKKTLNVHLVDILLSPVAINYYLSDGQDENSNFFEEMVQQFDITIIDASKKECIKELKENVHKYPEEFNKEEDLIRLAKDTKFLDRSSKVLTPETKLKLLHYFFKKPLILNFNKDSKNQVNEATKLCKIQETEIKLVILGKDIDVSKYSHLKIFTNLTEVDGDFLEKTKMRCTLSLQSRNISLEEIFENEMREFVIPREIFQMLKGSFSIGEDKENLPECYIPRTVSATVFDIESIIKHSSGTAAIIFYYEDKFEELKILIQNIVDCEDYLYENFLHGLILKKNEPLKKYSHQDDSRNTLPEMPAIILRKQECSRKQFDEICKVLRKKEDSKKKIPKEGSRKETYSNNPSDVICEKSKKKDVHLCQMIDGTRCLLLMSSMNTSFKENYVYTKISVEEENIHAFFNKSVNILCAQPGMGKSTLMKYLKTKCDPNFWTVKIDLKAHNQFLKKHHEIEDVLKYFLDLEKSPNKFSEHIKTAFLRKKKIALFLDGLDEVEQKCVKRVLEISKILGDMGFRIWLSSRQNLQQDIENYFGFFAIEINQLNEEQQKNYIENRLTSEYNKNEIEEIVDTIFSNTDLANTRQILDIPLQLHIITQIFLDSKSYNSNFSKNSFSLTKMFDIFFEGKYKHYLDKVKAENPHLLGELEEILKNYQIVALHSVLDDEHFLKLQLEKLTVVHIKNSDFLGIVTETNSEDKAVFEHLTYAEYYASKFFAKNFDKARILKEEIFTEKYQNLRTILNIMLAEDEPLHLAIIYKDLDRIEEMRQFSLVDKGKRNFLHVAACVGTRHPPLEFSSSQCLVKDRSVQHFKGEDSTMKEIVNRVLSNGEPFKNDEIFEWNSLQYALAAGALYMVEAILEKSEKCYNFYEILEKYYRDEVVAYYSIRFGYHRLLSEILAKKTCKVTGILSLSLYFTKPHYQNHSIFHFIFFPSECTNRTRIVELLTGDDINKIIYEKDGFTVLHFAIFHEDTGVVKSLLEKKANLNINDKYGRSPLILAVERNNLEISKLLVENGADVNIKDEVGRSPLYWAVQRNNLEISKLLVENGADVNIKNKIGESPLFTAVKQDNLEITKLLIERGAEVNCEIKRNESPLSSVIRSFKLLFRKESNVIESTKISKVLQIAAKRGNLNLFQILIEAGAIWDVQQRELVKGGKRHIALSNFLKN